MFSIAEGPDQHPWAWETRVEPGVRRRSWRVVPWEDLHAEALVWRGLRADFQHELERLEEDDPGRQTLIFGVEYAEMKLGDLLDALENTARHAPPGEAFPWPPSVRRMGETFAEAKARLDLPEVIERLTGLTLLRMGRQWTMCCPLPGHDDARPSFTVSPEKQVWYCHGCHRGGDVITFVQELYQLVNAGAALRALRSLGFGEDR
ncbi:MAG: CHC2 zinc finger domain-containing protein [Thermomicrobiales bacterium]